MVIGIDASRAFVEVKTGTENYSYMVIRHMLRLPESGAHTFVLFTRPNAIIPAWARQKNVIIKPIKLNYLWTQLGLAWETWKYELGVLWIPAHTLPVLRRFGLKTVVTIHGLEYRWLPEYRNSLQRWYLPLSTFYAAKRATKLIAVSQSTKNDLLCEIKTDPNKIKVIHEGVEQEFSNPKFSNSQMKIVWRKYGLEEKKYVLFVGTIQPRKNLVSLIRSWAAISAGLPDYKLVIAGGVGWMAEEVLGEPARLGVGDSVVFVGRVSPLVLHALYQGAVLYVQPSWTEGFGLPVIEAMQRGVPTVCSNGGALPEVAGDAGLVVALGDGFVERLSVALKQVIIDPKRREKMIARGHKRVASFDWSRTAKETLLMLVG